MNPHKAVKTLSREYAQYVDLYIDVAGTFHLRLLEWFIHPRDHKKYHEIQPVSSGKTIEEAVEKFHIEMIFHDVDCLQCNLKLKL